MDTSASTVTAHEHSANHREEILRSDVCGCFYCCSLFEPAAIEEWLDDAAGLGSTALCPRCGIDSVIGSASGYAITPEFLMAMHRQWFG